MALLTTSPNALFKISRDPISPIDHKNEKKIRFQIHLAFLTGCFGVSFSEKLVFGSPKVTQGHNNPKINTIEMIPDFKNLLF